MFRKYLVVIILLLSFFVAPSLAALQMQLDKDSVASDEVLTMVITSKDHISISPDLSPLKQDFQIVGTSQNSQLSIVNGSTQMETQWQIALLPKHSGEIVIPAIQVGNEKTESRIIHVLAAKNVPPQTSHNKDIFFEASVTPKEAYIQEQLVYTMKLFYNKSVENPYLLPPDLPDAKITQNGQDILYTAVKNGNYYRVLERSYLITPKNVGRVQIQPPVLKGYIEGNHNFFNSYSYAAHTMQPVKIVGPTIEINVKPKPGNFSGQWLPAKKLSLSDSWQPDPPLFKEGEPITRIVEVKVEGATGEQIPNLVLTNSPNINAYPQAPKRETEIKDGLQIGKLSQKIVYIPTKPGRLHLPSIKLSWWQSTTKREQVAVIAAKTIRVQPANKQTGAVMPLTPQPISKPVTSPISMPSAATSATKETSLFWPITAIVFILMWLTTLFLWRRQTSVTVKTTVFKGKKLTLGEKQRLLKDACFNHNPKLARSYFLDWAKAYWKTPKLHALSDVYQFLAGTRAEPLKSEIMKLEGTFYSKNKHNWNGNSFWTILQNYLHNKGSDKTTEDPLPPLHLSDEKSSN